MPDFLDRPIYGDFTVLHAIIALVAVLVLVAWLARWFGRKPLSPHLVVGTCAGCGWRGEVGKYARRCPRCNGEVIVGGTRR